MGEKSSTMLQFNENYFREIYLMKHYRCILVAADLIPEDDNHTIERAKVLAAQANAELYLIHVIEPLMAAGDAYAYPTLNDIQDEITDEHQQELKQEADRFGIPHNRVIIGFGDVANAINEKALELKADLIVVGTHTRHGLSVLLGSTSGSMINNAPCDMLIVRIPE